jgi:hypothetical protein
LRSASSVWCWGVKAILAGAKPADIKVKAVGELSSLSALLANKAPADALAYKTLTRRHRKGCRGSSPRRRLSRLRRHAVSDVEMATVGDIATALGVPGPAL